MPGRHCEKVRLGRPCQECGEGRQSKRLLQKRHPALEWARQAHSDLPERAGAVRRPAKVWVEALNEHGEVCVIEGEELLARALCHEIDHLDGILFIDKLIGEA